ncbi:MAG: cache domain-containing protein [Sulfuricurvum sp.]|uniref:cache domain-containing protein n=1 Tax=Sulfuricurvum sp. TaxID=2025608 RepID=UPI002614FBBF|nr:cache domain-containing protein [Sulfuricurvum sp.]MDD5119385.1 cache domain-containing protein [Sulfuricurvum sp.]
MRLYQKYLTLLLLILLTMIVYFYVQKKEEFVNRIDIVLMNLLDKQIEQEKAESFAFAFALAQNETLQTAIETNNTKKATEILKQYTSTLEVFSGSKVHAQIVTKDFIILARNWENSSTGLSIKAYRPDLDDIVLTHKPHLSFEAARRLVLIASIPVIKDKHLIGFIEVIQKLDAMKNYFANYDIDLLVLMDDKYKDQAVLLKNNPRIENMIVANDDANIHHISYLKRTGLNGLLTNGVLDGDNYVYFSRAILNADGQNIGSFVLVLSKKKMKLFNAFEEELDTFLTYSRKDLYLSVINHDPAANLWKNYTAEQLLSLKKCVHPEDKTALEERLRTDLEHYSKDELISLLLDTNSNQKSRGHIK